jgi:hypothetical protein
MKLVAIEHDRCNELDKTEFYLAPDEMTEEQLGEAVDSAVKQYLVQLDELEKLKPDMPYRELKNLPDTMTIAEGKQLLAEEEKVRQALWAEKQRLTGHFNDQLLKFGIAPLWQGKDIPTATAYWGHQHGKNLKY